MKENKRNKRKLLKEIGSLRKEILGLEKLKANLRYCEEELKKYPDDFEEQMATRTTAERMINKQLRHEILQRKLLERALQVTATRYQRLFETTKEGVLILDGDSGQIVDVNPALIERLGYTHEEFLKKKIWDIGVFKDIEASKAVFLELQTKKYVRYENQPLVTKAGQLLEVEFISNNYRIRDKKLIQCNIRDISERRRMDELKDGIVRTVAHELRSPLAIVKEGISVILENLAGDLTEKQGEILTLVDNTIDRLVRVTNNLLDVSRLETGGIELKKEFVDIADLIKDAVVLFGAKAGKKGLALKVRVPEEEQLIYVDKDKLFQVLTNLLGNAVKFTEKGSVEIAAEEKKDCLEISIMDTGRGINKDDLPLLFTKFKQFGVILNGFEKGSGLGLAISKDIIELHKGRMRVESEMGKGSRFVFTLPKAP
ncbi:MAG: PAS domain-containing sensor histidine kinase [Candidatus Omnitrophota bacterium]